MSEKETALAGIHQMSAEVYHADPCPQPSLSSSLAHVMWSESPLHCWTQSPRLNPAFQPEESKPMNTGKAVHALILEGANIIEYLDYADWRKDAAKDARDKARKAGKVPMLAHQRTDVEAMVEAVREQLSTHRDAKDAFTKGRPEQSLIWKDDGIWCRARIDWLHDSYLIIDDLKTTGITANPENLSRSLFSNGLDIQCAFHLRGLKKITGKDAIFRFVFIETQPPYALSVVALGPDSLMIGQKKVQYCIDLFRKCLESDEWPGYPTQTCYATLPAWEEARVIEKELREA